MKLENFKNSYINYYIIKEKNILTLNVMSDITILVNNIYIFNLRRK